ncbi:MAG: SGNH/GDSL hydrolase family protein [Verrucomicrobiota bacterium]
MKTILGFGASSMYGSNDSQGGFLRRMELILNQNEQHFKFVNQGVRGNTTREMIARVSEAEKCNADQSIVLLGCNDMPRKNEQATSQRSSLEEYAENLEILFQRLPGQKNIFITSFYSEWVEEDLFSQYMKIALQKAKKYRYEIWDLYHESKPFLSQYVDSDLLHFNDAGHQYISETLLKRL